MLSEEFLRLKDQSFELKNEINRLSSVFEDKEAYDEFKYKNIRSVKKKNWRKRNKQFKNENKEKKRKLGLIMEKFIDEWQNFENDKEKKINGENDNPSNNIDNKQEFKKDNILLISQLEQLRRIRLKKLIGEGKPIEDLDPVNKIIEEAKENDQFKKIDKSSKLQNIDHKEQESTIYSVPELHFYQSYENILNLVHIRTQWDSYIIPAGSGGTRIPPHFISPPIPPDDSPWKEYISKNEK